MFGPGKPLQKSQMLSFQKALFFPRILNMNKVSLCAKFHAYIHIFVFKIQTIKNGFTGLSRNGPQGVYLFQKLFAGLIFRGAYF